MALSDRAARGILAAATLALLGGALRLDLPRATGGQFWSDGATYHAMAWSLAEDFDLRYEARDLYRVRREFPGGPQGLFLKRTAGGLCFDYSTGFPWLRRSGGGPQERIYYAKAFAYPLAAAPFVRLFGTNGLLVTNALALALAIWLGYAELRGRARPAVALAGSLVLFLGTVTPLYLVWLTPELFNLGLVAAGLVATRRRPLLAAVLLGIATYSKPYNLLLALPLGFAPFLPALRRSATRPPPALREAVRRGSVFGAVVVALFAFNAAATGELNYQGGERKTFYGRFPFERDATGRLVTFGNSGIWMTTEHWGPLVAGRDDQKESRRTGPLRPATEMRASFLRNLGYFWVGRFGGVLAYFCPALLAVLAFLVLGPREALGWLAAAALLCSYLFYIVVIPDNWYGGGGTVGNRYFLNLLPLALFLLPRGREGPVLGLGLLGSALFLGPVLAAPIHHSLHPGAHATAPAFRALPAELTMLNDLAIFTEPWRKKQPFGFVGDAETPAEANAYSLYFLDDGTYGKEAYAGGSGFWVRAGSEAEVVLRVFDIAPLRRVVLEATAGSAADVLSCALDGQQVKMTIGPGEAAQAVFAPARGFPYYETFLHVLRCDSTAQATALTEGRRLGAFVRIGLETAPVPAGARDSGPASGGE